MKLLLNKDITQKTAADMMVLTKSQTVKIKKAYKSFGLIGLISKRTGKRSPNNKNDKKIEKDDVHKNIKKYSHVAALIYSP